MLPLLFFGAFVTMVSAQCSGLPLSGPPLKPPFSPSEVDTMRTFFLHNLNYNNSGGVIAAPDPDVGAGGSYEFNWMRDAGLSMRALFMTFPANNSVIDMMKTYLGWVLRNQLQMDPNGQTVLTEPKFNIPSGTVFSGGWCRPQTDGPAIRGATLVMFGNFMLDKGDSATVSKVWTAVKRDLDWVAASGWTQPTCDLWEELRVNDGDLFWNRMAHYKALFLGSMFARRVGQESTANEWLKAAALVNSTLMSHWNGKMLFEAENRQLDTAVFAALNNHYTYDSAFHPLSSYVAQTFLIYTQYFCQEYPINAQDTNNGIPGMLYGRYQGDHYFGGNPWILLTANAASILYRAAAAVQLGGSPQAWNGIVAGVTGGSSSAEALTRAADGILLRIRAHVAGDGFHLNEQLDRDSGYEISANDLTWSYAAVLNALNYRNQVA